MQMVLYIRIVLHYFGLVLTSPAEKEASGQL